jgi:hypothetical protein
MIEKILNHMSFSHLAWFALIGFSSTIIVIASIIVLILRP